MWHINTIWKDIFLTILPWTWWKHYDLSSPDTLCVTLMTFSVLLWRHLYVKISVSNSTSLVVESLYHKLYAITEVIVDLTPHRGTNKHLLRHPHCRSIPVCICFVYQCISGNKFFLNWIELKIVMSVNHNPPRAKSRNCPLKNAQNACERYN